jgi:hypothetical protein
VTLKERRTLVVVPRETPLSRGHLVQLLALHDAGAVVLPASPAFYAGATDLQQLVDFVAGRVLDALGVEHTLYRRWTGRLGPPRGRRRGPRLAQPVGGAARRRRSRCRRGSSDRTSGLAEPAVTARRPHARDAAGDRPPADGLGVDAEQRRHLARRHQAIPLLHCRILHCRLRCLDNEAPGRK